MKVQNFDRRRDFWTINRSESRDGGMRAGFLRLDLVDHSIESFGLSSSRSQKPVDRQELHGSGYMELCPTVVIFTIYRSESRDGADREQGS